MMTKKHFKMFAVAIADMSDEIDREKITAVCCDVFYTDNPKFDYDRFKEYVRRLRAGEDLKGLR